MSAFYYLDWYLQLNEEICELMYTIVSFPCRKDRANKQTKRLVGLHSSGRSVTRQTNANWQIIEARN